ncbi:hypothetical protein ACUTR7_16125 [Delftia sp. NA_296.1]|uniref:hypothetical protein n=1 Tax=Delftia sp. NA_296.1 TaxID=3415648 RepID=UPI00404600F6
MNELPAVIRGTALLQGEVISHKIFMDALYAVLSPAQKTQFAEHFESFAESARNSLLPEAVPEACIEGFESSIREMQTKL